MLPDKHDLYQVMMTLHFLNDVANETESTQKSKIYVIIACLKSETMGKLINRLPGECFFISSLQAFSMSCLVNLISKDTHLVFSIFVSRHDSYKDLQCCI